MADEKPVQRSYSRETRLKAETLFVIKGLKPREIAEKIGITPQSVSNMATRYDWVARREKRANRALARAEDRTAAATGEFLESVTIQSQELAEKGFEFARTAPDGKEFADSMRGTKIAVDLARQGLGIDAQATTEINVTLNAIMAQPIEDVAEPAQEVQVTEIPDGEITLDFDQSQQSEIETVCARNSLGND